MGESWRRVDSGIRWVPIDRPTRADQGTQSSVINSSWEAVVNSKLISSASSSFSCSWISWARAPLSLVKLICWAHVTKPTMGPFRPASYSSFQWDKFLLLFYFHGRKKQINSRSSLFPCPNRPELRITWVTYFLGRGKKWNECLRNVPSWFETTEKGWPT